MGKYKSRLPALSYQEQNHLQDIAIRYGMLLDYKQMQKFVDYRKQKAFAQSCDLAILYLVLTPAQRERYDRNRDQSN